MKFKTMWKIVNLLEKPIKIAHKLFLGKWIHCIKKRRREVNRHWCHKMGHVVYEGVSHVSYQIDIIISIASLIKQKILFFDFPFVPILKYKQLAHDGVDILLWLIITAPILVITFLFNKHEIINIYRWNTQWMCFFCVHVIFGIKMHACALLCIHEIVYYDVQCIRFGCVKTPQNLIISITFNKRKPL